MKEKTLINKINKAVPEARAVPAVEFYGYKTEGIWFKGTESGYHDNKPIFIFGRVKNKSMKSQKK